MMRMINRWKLEKSDPKSLLVKLADRLHNMRTLASKSKERQVSIAQETLDFFVPVAQHLKQPTIEEELVALASQYLNFESIQQRA